MQCQNCRAPLDENEPVYRFPTGYGTIWYDRWRGAIGSLCAACVSKIDDLNWLRWRPAEPCCRCGRPVILSTKRKRPMYVVCGQSCRVAVYNAAARDRRNRWRTPYHCATCGENFEPKRTDARFCSVACKQKAYRRRHGSHDRRAGLDR